jgi:hypothetical protein
MPSTFDVALVQCLMTGSVGALFYYFAGALGSKQLARMIRFVTILLIVNLAAGVTWEGIVAVRDKVNGIADAINNFADKFSWLTERPTPAPLVELPELSEISPPVDKKELWDWLTRLPKGGS